MDNGLWEKEDNSSFSVDRIESIVISIVNMQGVSCIDIKNAAIGVRSSGGVFFCKITPQRQNLAISRFAPFQV